MSTNLEYRARERQRKRESGRQASEAQREKGRQGFKARDKKQRIILVEEQHDNEKCLRPAMQGENKRQ